MRQLVWPLLALSLAFQFSLGLPLSTRLVPTSCLTRLIDKIIKKLATWKASLLSHRERLALVRQVLSVMPVHILLAMSINSTILKKITRFIREFLWHGWKDAKSGNYAIS